jgi:ribosomal protein S18 acetylase RimI-like enzyme
MTAATITYDLLDSAAAASLADDLVALQQLGIAGTPEADDPFESPERFRDRLTRYMAAPGFALVTARAGEMVGYAFGYLLPPNARWWDGILDPVTPDLLTETGSRTFAVNEIHVHPSWRGRGIATGVHSRLVRSGDWERATLLVRQDNEARHQYAHWGYKQISRLKPFPDSPTYLALVLPADAVRS